MTADMSVAHLPDLIKQVQAGHEVLLTQDGKHVAKIVAASESSLAPKAPLQVRSLTGHRVQTPVISQSEVADEMFSRQ
jgi:prevent-host-death family protein